MKNAFAKFKSSGIGLAPEPIVPSMLSLPVAELAESFESSGNAVESLCDFRYGELVNSNWTDHYYLASHVT